MGWDMLNAPLPERPEREITIQGQFLCQRDSALEAAAVGAIRERLLLEQARFRRHQAIIDRMEGELL